MSKIKISVMIASYNQKEFVLDAVYSAMQIEYENLEIVVLDDCSVDGSYTSLKEVELKDKRVKVYKNEKNLGRTKTYKRLLYELAGGEWVIMLDGDDYFVKSRFFEKAIEVIEKYPSVVCICGGYIKKWKDRLKVKIPNEKYFSDGLEISLMYPDIVYAHGAVLYKRDKALEIDSYRAGIVSDDLETHLRLFSCGGVYFVNEAVYVWQIHGGNETFNISYDEYVFNIKKMIQMSSLWLEVKNPTQIYKIKKWKIRCFMKLYRIALFVYGLKRRVSLFESLKDIKDYFSLYYFITTGLFFLLPLYFVLPSFLLRWLKMKLNKF